ncbi:hypothetical protein O6H91_03G116000 [Diphasiastrum complanatum]|uniref:Uncharacterized protein n=1 Tax=Diphasiastrum complanatum TaxID=34168 RepID=A0ACC2EAV1_DIPCM|nr:hypothetical protein O6H91_03G116000 [Diphasiastrum complanatum]
MALEVFSNIKIPNHRSGGYYALNASLVSAPLKASIVNSFGSRRHFDLDNLTSHVPELQFWSLIDTRCSPFFTALCSRSSCSHNVALYRSCGLRSSSFRHKKLSLSRNNLCECSYLSFGQSLGWSRGELWGELLLENNYYHAAVQLKKRSSPSADTTKACNFTRRNRLKIKLQPHGFTIVRSHLNFLGKHSSVQSDYWYPVKSLDSEQFLNKEFATQATGRPDFSLHTKLKCLARYLEYGGQVAEDSWECLLGSFSAGRQKEEKPEIHSSWKVQRWRPNRSNHQKTSIRAQFTQAQLLTSARPRQALQPDYFPHRQVRRNCVPQSRDTPPKRDTGIASEKDWGITLNNGKTNESGVNEDGSTWYRENGVDIGDNGYRCRWTVMGGQSADSSIEWKEAWWEKSDWTGYKELGAEKSGKNAAGDSWWETWQEVLRQDDWRF